MTMTQRRLAGWALIIGTIVATAGYVAAGTLVRGSGDARFTNPWWTPLNGIALAGDIIALLGLPVILSYHERRAPRLTLIGYVGLTATLVMLNIGEGCIETFVKPYLARHGGVPANAPGGLSVFEGVALVCLVAGLICLGIAVIRARVFPRWAGALFIASVPAGFLTLPGPLAELSDYLAFMAVLTIGLHVVRTESARPVLAPRLAEAAPAAS